MLDGMLARNALLRRCAAPVRASARPSPETIADETGKARGRFLHLQIDRRCAPGDDDWVIVILPGARPNFKA